MLGWYQVGVLSENVSDFNSKEMLDVRKVASLHFISSKQSFVVSIVGETLSLSNFNVPTQTNNNLIILMTSMQKHKRQNKLQENPQCFVPSTEVGLYEHGL